MFIGLLKMGETCEIIVSETDCFILYSSTSYCGDIWPPLYVKNSQYELHWPSQQTPVTC